MRTTRSLAVSAAAVAVLGLAAPAAVAWDGMNDPDGSGGYGGGFGGNGDHHGGFGGNGGFGGDGFGRDGFGGDGFGGNGGGFGGNGGDHGGGFGGNGGHGGHHGGNGRFFPRNIAVMPRVIARGGQVTITVDGCPNGGTATSRAFPRARLFPSRGGNDTARGIATVHTNARPGPYDVTVHCSGSTLTRPNAFAVIGGVRGGIGGSSSTGATPTDMVIGGGLVAAAVVGGGVFWMRRRSEKRI
ncbi:hypothetical protein OG828_05265 [Streptomyces sp. NBC_00457]|uniref:hypothetical protein n=1 Tax=Streptomyces sp. NBC_00457 TaxID=2975748 RepID=UPI0030DFA25F